MHSRLPSFFLFGEVATCFVGSLFRERETDDRVQFLFMSRLSFFPWLPSDSCFVPLLSHFRVHLPISLKIFSKRVSCELDKFRVDTLLCKLRNTPAPRLSYGCLLFYAARCRAPCSTFCVALVTLSLFAFRLMAIRCGTYSTPPSKADLVPGTKTLYMSDGQAVNVVAAHADSGESPFFVAAEVRYSGVFWPGCDSFLFLLPRSCGIQ